MPGLRAIQRRHVGEKLARKPFHVARLFAGATTCRADDLIDQFLLLTVIIVGHWNPQTDVGTIQRGTLLWLTAPVKRRSSPYMVVGIPEINQFIVNCSLTPVIDIQRRGNDAGRFPLTDDRHREP